jgi:ubiquinone/menaquinone biosynthesis C-methylase UbiE
MEHQGWRFPPERREVLIREDRAKESPPGPILHEAGVTVGETVVDLGAGNGFWIQPLLDAVGEQGMVYAADVEPIMVDDLRRLVEERGLSNVQPVLSDELSVPLPSNIADMVLLSYVLHEPGDIVAFLQEVVRLLKPDGRVLVLEWQKWPTQEGPPVEHRISQEEAQALLGDIGLSVRELSSPSPDVYILLASHFHPDDLEINAPTI